MTQPRVFAPAILSGLLLWCAFYPFNLGFVAYFALAPFLSLVRVGGVSARRRYLAAYVGGLAFFLPALQWIRVAHPAMYAAWIGLAMTSAAYFPIGLLLIRRLDRLKLPLGVSAAVVWVALEYVRAHFPVGFPFLKPLGLHQLIGFAWYYLGHTQHDYPAMIQVADLGGVWLISFMMAVVNGAVAEWAFRFPVVGTLLRWRPDRRVGFYHEMWAASFATLAFVLVYGYGIFTLTHPPFEKGPQVSAIQADFPQDVKMNDEKKLFAEYNRLCETAALRHPDLIVWPETCFPDGYTAVTDPPPAVIPEGVKRGLQDNAVLSNFALQRWRTNVLLGAGLDEWDGEQMWRYNSAVLLGPDGAYQGRYDKMHLVPFGEYVPLKGAFPWLQRFTPYKGDYSCKPGEKQTRFAIMAGDVQYTFGVLICYEDSEPYLARQFNLRDGDDRPVDFIVNISNDGWFRGSEEHEQHLAICKFRAVEARRSVVRAVNMGISAIINSDGVVQALPHNSVKESLHHVGTVSDKIRLDPRPSYYARVGDWPPAVCWAAIGVGLLIARRRTGAPA